MLYLLQLPVFGVGDEDQKQHLCRLQNAILVLIHTLAYTIIYLRTEDEKALMFFGAQLLFFFLYMGLYRLFYHNLSRLLLNNAWRLSTSFIIMTRLSMDRAVRQFAIVVAAAAMTMIIPFIMDRAWQLSKFHGCMETSVCFCFWWSALWEIRLSELSYPSPSGFSFQPSGVCQDQLCVFRGDYVLPVN